jgi:hypothetical protein
MGQMAAADYFAGTYRSAREKFLAACRDLRMRPTALRPEQLPEESAPPLLEYVRLGRPDADHILVICGGDRQVDALCCSALEIGWLSEFARANLPGDTAILLLHHGAAPATGGEVAADAGPPPVWEDDLLAKVEQRYAEYARRQNIDATGAPLPAPADADAPGYPGEILDEIARVLDSAVTGRIAIVDVRVGLGAYGEAEITPCHPQDSDAAKRVRSWFNLGFPRDGAEEDAQMPGSLAAGLMRRLTRAQVTAFTASFGTYSMQSVLDSLAARPEGQAMLDPRGLLFPEADAWRDAVWRNAIMVVQRALTALHAK